MIKAYKYKIKPTDEQQQQLLQFFDCARFVYNWGLDRKYKEHRPAGTVLKKIRKPRGNGVKAWREEVTNPMNR